MREESKELTSAEKFFWWHYRFVSILVVIMAAIAVLNIWLHWK